MIKQQRDNQLLSSRNDLERRGYIDHLDLHNYSKSLKTNLMLLHDKIATNRSIGASRLVYHLSKLEVIENLLLQLDKEKALYTRLAICNTLAQGNQRCARVMISYLGKIGNNQYQSLPAKISKKKSFPLPRDIVARTLGRMDPKCIRVFLKELPTCSLLQARELIDAIGYMVFNMDIDKKMVFKALYAFDKTNTDNIIKWKLIQVYGWLQPYSIHTLNEIQEDDGILFLEAQKALKK